MWAGFYLDGKPYAPKAEDGYGVFCGIANPQRFFAGLESYIPERRMMYIRAFPDHHVYSPQDLQDLKEQAANLELTHWITTEKDYVRLAAKELGKPVLTARVEYDVPDGLVELIRQKLEKV